MNQVYSTSQSISLKNKSFPKLNFLLFQLTATIVYSHGIVLVDLNEISSVFLKVHLSHSRHQETTSNFFLFFFFFYFFFYMFLLKKMQ